MLKSTVLMYISLCESKMVRAEAVQHQLVPPKYCVIVGQAHPDIY